MTRPFDEDHLGVFYLDKQKIVRSYEYEIVNLSGQTTRDNVADFKEVDVFGDATLILKHDITGSTDSWVYQFIGRTQTSDGGDGQEYTYHTTSSLTVDTTVNVSLTGLAHKEYRIIATRTGSTDIVAFSVRLVQNVKYTLGPGTARLVYDYPDFNRVTRFWISPKLIEATWQLAIVAEDLVGNQSTPVLVSKTLDYFPDPVTSFSATLNSGNTVTLTWVDPTDSDLNNLQVFSDGGIGSTTPDYSTALASIASGVQTHTTGILGDGNYIFGIRATDTVQNTETNVDVLAYVQIPVPRPYRLGFDSDITDLFEDQVVIWAVANSGGKVLLTWEYFQDKANAVASVFKIYTDGGTGTIDFINELDSVNRNTDTTVTLHSFTSSRLVAATKFSENHQFVIRAETATGIDDENTDAVTVTLFGKDPEVPETVTGSTIRAIESRDGTV